MIDSLDCIGILIVIDKNKLRVKNPTWFALDTAWLFLLERYEAFLKENSIKSGHIKADKSSNKTHRAIINTARRLADCGTIYHHTSRVREPLFVDSGAVYGIQIADAFAYCTLKHKMNHEQFSKYWKIIHGKLRRNDLGTVHGYGYKEYPK